jgi:hypothetical protein
VGWGCTPKIPHFLLSAFPQQKRRVSCRRIAKKNHIVIPAKAGIHRQYEAWIPAFAGMTPR